ncbi:hypothetical protein MOPEL_029_01700 [Mobilicoccus pelagius NBRC 104925]|uniref:Uncharacterized protein n=1 Tax=Mobilicoccus pelagius NBRC 104925 TaxID=1089455 RepID=H5UQ82_9MICO|nr:hypothetical protein MOPEL_029_01700 [Mobilicoccus pelagius NBRC 104925]
MQRRFRQMAAVVAAATTIASTTPMPVDGGGTDQLPPWCRQLPILCPLQGADEVDPGVEAGPVR